MRRAPGARVSAVVAVTWAVVVAVLVGLAPVGAAHNSRTAFSDRFGPYEVTASTEVGHAGGDHRVVLDLALRTTGVRRPVEDAEVEVTATGGGRRIGPVEAERYGGTYRAVIPDDGVERWDLGVEVRGPAGDVAFERAIPGAAEGGPDVAGHGAAAVRPWMAAAVVAVFGLAVLTPFRSRLGAVIARRVDSARG